MLKNLTLIAAVVVLTAGLLMPASAMGQAPVLVEIDTTEGKIVLQLDAEKAPETVKNFLAYVENGHYVGTVFHRVMPEFMIQGGGMDSSLVEKETLPPIRNEASNGLKNDEYTVAMARTSNPNSATSQFFINTSGKNSFLNRTDPNSDGFGYAVFGKVVEGKEVVDKIEAKPTRSVPHPQVPQVLMENVPVEPITIKGVKVLSGSVE